MTKQIAYKVVRFHVSVPTEQRWYFSAKAHGDAEVEYVPGLWSNASPWLARQGYHLTAFGAVEHAQAFSASGGFFPKVSGWRREIWECEVKGLIKPLPPICYVETVAKGEVGPAYFAQWPPNTVMARAIKLTQKVEREDACLQRS